MLFFIIICRFLFGSKRLASNVIQGHIFPFHWPLKTHPSHAVSLNKNFSFLNTKVFVHAKQIKIKQNFKNPLRFVLLKIIFPLGRNYQLPLQHTLHILFQVLLIFPSLFWKVLWYLKPAIAPEQTIRRSARIQTAAGKLSGKEHSKINKEAKVRTISCWAAGNCLDSDNNLE